MSRLSALAQCLVDKFSISQEEADGFIRELFAIIRERLETDKIVKVRGLGTFKLAEMSPRESIAINSGERIVIEGKYKFTFTPENGVRNRINSPFAQFESMDLDDDIAFDDIDDKYRSMQEEALAEEETPSGAQTPSATETPLAEAAGTAVLEKGAAGTLDKAPVVEAETPAETIASPLEDTAPPAETPAPPVEDTTPHAEDTAPLVETAVSPVDEPSPAADAAVEPQEEISGAGEEPIQQEEALTAGEETPSPGTDTPPQGETAPVTEESQPETEAAEITPMVELSEPAQEEDKPAAAPIEPSLVPATQNPSECEELMRESVSHSRTIVHLLYGILILVAVGLLVMAGYFCYQLGISVGESRQPQQTVAQKAPKQAGPKAGKQAAEGDMMTPHPSDAGSGAPAPGQPQAKPGEKAPVTQGKTAPAPAPKMQEPAAPAKREAPEEEYNKDARVRTGAYAITGLDTTVTVIAGQTFKGICKAYLGEGMECYVEVFNGGMKEAKPGDRIRIPKLKLKKKIKKQK